MKLIATRNGVRMYEVGRTAQHGIAWPWIGKTWAPTLHDSSVGEIGAATVFEDDGKTSRWAVVPVSSARTEPTLETLRAAVETEGRLAEEAAREVDKRGYYKLSPGEFWG